MTEAGRDVSTGRVALAACAIDLGRSSAGGLELAVTRQGTDP